MGFMFNSFLSENCRIDSIGAYTAAGTSTVTSSAIDMQGYEAVLIIAKLGTTATNNTAKLQQSSDDGATDTYDDLAGSKLTPGTNNEVQFLLEAKNLQKRYVKAVFARGTSSTLSEIFAIRYPARSEPVTQATTTLANKLNAPAEGTA